MSDRETLLQGAALAGLIKSFDSRLVDVQRRFTRWPGAASAITLPLPLVFTPGTLGAHSWQDAVSVTVGRGSWFVIANATIQSESVVGYPSFTAAMRVNGSDDASAEARDYHSGAAAGMMTSLQSFSTFTTTDASAVISLQVSQATDSPSVPSILFHPTLTEAFLVARPI